MVTVKTLHILIIGIYFIVASQVLPFQEELLSFMLIIGIVLVVLGTIFRIIRAVGLKIKKEFGKAGNSKPKIKGNNYLTYFLIFVAVITVLYGSMTMPNGL